MSLFSILVDFSFLNHCDSNVNVYFQGGYLWCLWYKTVSPGTIQYLLRKAQQVINKNYSFIENTNFICLYREYKFYLAFENSNCKDYITEKFFVNGLK